MSRLSEAERLVIQRALELVAGGDDRGGGGGGGEHSRTCRTPAASGGGGEGDREAPPRRRQETPTAGDGGARASRDLRTPRSAALELSSLQPGAGASEYVASSMTHGIFVAPLLLFIRNFNA